ncbi:TolC family protein [Arcticibacterium luteifluviistationis]|uniref:Transporter n=1 Tax=Arcticibacterium luteifluviistationis TaxID=1784714 RepID=A0A2Z4GFM9_9BACT|nr:TolC family protein [Arcticibacterium luteifluviistationis]AWV99788.1 transporter [Arcticibacterium luteifluviistationis]
MKKLTYLFVLCSFGALAQERILDAYIEEGLSTNLALKQQKLEIEKSVKAIDIARSNIFPKITFAPNYTVAAGGRSIEFPIGDLLNPVYGSLNQLTQSDNFPMVENQNIQFAPNNFHETKFTFELPLFNPEIKYNILLQRDLVQTEEAKRRLLEYELKYNIEAAYYQYLQSLEALDIYKNSAVFLNQYLDFNQRLVKNQLALKDVVYASEYEINKLEGEIANAEKNIDKAKAYFNFLINRPFDSLVEVDTLLLNKLPIVQEVDALQNAAILHRPEFSQLQAGMNVNNTLLQLQEKSAKLPSVYFGGSTGFQGYGYTFNKQAYAIGQLGLNWDIFHGNEKKHKIQQTEIQGKILEVKQQEAEQQIKMQVAQAYIDYSASLKALKASEAALGSTASLLEIVEKKYKNKDALYIELIKAQNDNLIAAQKTSLAKFDIWLKKSVLDKVSAK